MSAFTDGSALRGDQPITVYVRTIVSGATVTVRTAHQVGDSKLSVVAAVYPNAIWHDEPPWLVIQHEDPTTKGRCITRVPLANIVQVVEAEPGGKAS